MLAEKILAELEVWITGRRLPTSKRLTARRSSSKMGERESARRKKKREKKEGTKRIGRGMASHSRDIMTLSAAFWPEVVQHFCTIKTFDPKKTEKRHHWDLDSEAARYLYMAKAR